MAATAQRNWIVAVTGASGALYATRFLKAVLEQGARVDLVASDYGRRLLLEETELNLKTDRVEEWIARRYGMPEPPGSVTVHRVGDLGARIASGSQSWDGMVIVPCSMKTLAGVVHGSSSNLIERAADVTLKERRPLVLVPRESPLSPIHLENLLRASRAGAAIVPAMPAFYQKPQTFDDLADFVVGRVLSILRVPHRLYEPWE